MKYYVMALEQTLINGVYNEYAPAVKQYNDFSSAQVYFLARLAELANSSAHTYAQLKIINSKGAEVDSYIVREYVDLDAVEE